ncbi:AraC family transcriptional regulator [Sporosarcina sp.]|uniref:helix-turn-helix domain-containing protein n=1 Tax=Sporosarcina sp. TaxID=49982 RepID=UPI0026369931|nr:AraC family transcriptional regulator [Sporosarcina sp.]
MTSKKTEVVSLELISAVEKENSAKEAKTFFHLEEQLLRQIFNLERDGARDTLREIQQILSLHTPEFSIKVIQYYFIVLSSLVTRRLKEEAILNEKNAFTFSGKCVELVEENLTAMNANEIGDELIEFYWYVLKEKEAPSLSHGTVNGVIEYINENLEEQLVVEEIAKLFNVSTSHLSRIFRECTGVTLVEFITIRKIEEVQYYLRFTDQKIADIAERFHFCNQSYFTRVFKKYTGLTPRRFRKYLDGNYFQFDVKKDDSL